MKSVKRIVDTSFWTDEKVEDFSPEDKYFWLFLLTNPNTTQLGIYKITVKQASFFLGYSKEATVALFDRFENVYGLIRYIDGEVAIKNYLRHSIVKGGKPVADCLKQDMKQVKHKELIDWVFANIKDESTLNKTVLFIIKEYITLKRNINDNDNDNDNDSIVPPHVGVSSTNRERIANDSSRSDKGERANKLNTFIALYPQHRIDLAYLDRAFNQLDPNDELFDTMLKSLEQYKVSPDWTKQDGRFVPSASKWVSERRWERNPGTRRKTIDELIDEA